MFEPLTDAELQSFCEYAETNVTEFDGTQSQWANYTIRMVDEIRCWREYWKNENA